MDIRNTKIKDLPNEFCLLKKLYELDFSNSPLETFLGQEHGIVVGDVYGLKSLYRYRYDRGNLRDVLREKLENEQFPGDADKPNFFEVIDQVTEDAFNLFTDLAEFRLFVRRVDKLLPQTIDDVASDTLSKAQALFYALRDDTTRHRLSADLEIKIRGIYFDRIERSHVEVIIRSIYEFVKSLEDIQFLVQYAAHLFPKESPEGVNGELIWKNILALQAELKGKRDTAIAAVVGVMAQLYPEQEPHLIEERALEIAKLYQKERFATKKELNKMSQIVAEASNLFPPDFVSATPEQITRNSVAFFNKNKQ